MDRKVGKVGIITLHGYTNYGNRLQNYALQEVIKSLGLEVETIVLANAKPRRKRVINRLISFTNVMLKIKQKLIKLLNKNLIEQREEIFMLFSESFLREKFYGMEKSTLEGVNNKYSYFITGSDQVWNPDYLYYLYGSSVYFLTFAEKHKRIAYAPSFGVSEIKPEFTKCYKEWISGMHRLSVREDDGAKIIKDLTGKDVPVLVDPTLLLTKEKWISIAKEASNKPENKYLLTYFLGSVPDNYKEQIKHIAKKNRLEVINLGDVREKETYRTGPSEFIDYVSSCSIMCTDSFHGTVFSILFEKPFIVYERVGATAMYSRINTLLSKFNLNSRKAENILHGENVFEIDFSHTPLILDIERKKALDYLKEALNVKV